MNWKVQMPKRLHLPRIFHPLLSLTACFLAAVAIASHLPSGATAKRHHSQSNFEPVYEHRRYRPYETVAINDQAARSAGLYLRISQKGVDYMASLVSDALPEIFTRMVLPNVDEGQLSVRNLVITRFDKPYISVKFVKGVGIDLSLRLPHLEITGTPELSLFFASYRAQMLATNRNLTLEMRVSIHRNLAEPSTVVTVERCEANPGNLSIHYYGADASEFHSISSMIQGEVQAVVKKKLCEVPNMLSDFLHQEMNNLIVPVAEEVMVSTRRKRSIGPETDGDESTSASSTVLDHICKPVWEIAAHDEVPRQRTQQATAAHLNDSRSGQQTGAAQGSPTQPPPDEDDAPDVEIGPFKGDAPKNSSEGAADNDGGEGEMGLWIPDLTLRYPPTFSSNDFIVGIDGGVLVDGESVADFVDRPKFANVTLIRDQMLGLIISEYVPNTLFYQLQLHRVGSVSVIYSLRHVPKFLRTVAKFVCSDCRLVLTVRLLDAPKAIIDERNGIMLALESEVGAHFLRKNKTHNLLTSKSELRVVLKPHFRHSRLHSDVLLAGFELKATKASASGLIANAARKLITWLVPRAIWPKVQQQLRAAIHYKGVELPRFCTLELQRLHIDYVQHAAVISGDFDVDLPLLLRAFHQFMDEKQRNTRTRAELEKSIRYL